MHYIDTCVYAMCLYNRSNKSYFLPHCIVGLAPKPLTNVPTCSSHSENSSCRKRTFRWSYPALVYRHLRMSLFHKGNCKLFVPKKSPDVSAAIPDPLRLDRLYCMYVQRLCDNNWFWNRDSRTAWQKEPTPFQSMEYYVHQEDAKANRWATTNRMTWYH